MMLVAWSVNDIVSKTLTTNVQTRIAAHSHTQCLAVSHVGSDDTTKYCG